MTVIQAMETERGAAWSVHIVGVNPGLRRYAPGVKVYSATAVVSAEDPELLHCCARRATGVYAAGFDIKGSLNAIYNRICTLDGVILTWT